MIRKLNYQYKALRHAVLGIGVPSNDVERYTLECHVKNLHKLHDQFMFCGAFGDAERVNTTILAAKINIGRQSL